MYVAVPTPWRGSLASVSCRMPNLKLGCRASLEMSSSITTTHRKQFPDLVGTNNDTASSTSIQWGSSSVQAKVQAIVLKQADLAKKRRSDLELEKAMGHNGTTQLLKEAYQRCGQICAVYAKTFYLGTLLMTPERKRAIWAIYVWCRRTDELVDGPNASHITSIALDRWEKRLEDLFNGHPYDMLDAALFDTVSKFPLDIQLFKDMIEGMRMDLKKSRYRSFEELFLYCYYVAGTVGLMSVPVMGISSDSKARTEDVYSAALALGIANQLTNILRDVGEDARRGRIYLPQEELQGYGISDDDIMSGDVTENWKCFMEYQIRRARKYFDEARKGVTELDKASRWPVNIYFYFNIICFMTHHYYRKTTYS
eukprot:TRINITY_DN289_c0_g1_i1.p1 TRINITY_DN289_c0_g1~~TRINITY_DN289_c0_g1_i1.p1  ORF type:complete len:368 (-),score=60.50 TRINITY_DN289_c0_g1_i1:39-1142(-)